jgi:hypothetical protein
MGLAPNSLTTKGKEPFLSSQLKFCPPYHAVLAKSEECSKMLVDEVREVMKRGGVSFAELSRIEGFNGDLSLCHGTYNNIVFWVNMSREAIDAIHQIREEGDYEMTPTPFMVYLIDGMALDLPLVKRRTNYKKPHWLPVAFNPVKRRGPA